MKRIPSIGFTLHSFQEIDNLQFQFLNKKRIYESEYQRQGMMLNEELTIICINH